MSSVNIEHVWKIYKLKDREEEAVKDLNFLIEDGEMLGILGPSGCGKSSTLRMIAGLEDVSRGTIYFDEDPVNDLSPPERNIALAFETYALYYTMNVYNNLAFPLISRKVPKKEIKERIYQIADMFELTDKLRNMPGSLSGGHQQRVSLARAMIRDPRVLLLDEPLSHSDQHVRSRIRARIKHIHEELKTTTIYVTHDQAEAVDLCDRIAVVDLGVLQQLDNVDNLWNKPVNKFVAGFLGEPSMNFLGGKVTKSDEVIIKGETTPLALDEKIGDEHIGSEATIGIRPENIKIVDEDGKNIIGGTVTLTEPQGDYNIVNAKIGDFKVKIIANAALKFRSGNKVNLSIPPQAIHVFDNKTEKALNKLS